MYLTDVATAFRANFSDLEIEMFFSRYDNDGDFKFDCNETKKVRRSCGVVSTELKNLPLNRSLMILRMTLMVTVTLQAVH